MAKPIKPDFIVPVEGAEEFETQASTALGQIPPVVDYIDDSSRFQVGVYNDPTSRGILPTPTGLLAGNSYAPLRLDPETNSLSVNRGRPYFDGGGLASCKALTDYQLQDGYRYVDTPLTMQAQVDNLPITYSFIATNNNFQDLTVTNTYAGVTSSLLLLANRFVPVDNMPTRFPITLRSISLSAVNDSGTPTAITVSGDAGITSGAAQTLSIYVARLTITPVVGRPGTVISARVARFAGTSITTVMAPENGYQSLADGHPNLVFTGSIIEPVAVTIGRTLAISSGMGLKLYDAQIQAGSGFNILSNA